MSEDIESCNYGKRFKLWYKAAQTNPTMSIIYLVCHLVWLCELSYSERSHQSLKKIAYYASEGGRDGGMEG